MDTSKQKIALIGLGYVGLPLAVEFGKVRPVLGFDINETRIAELRSGKDSTLEVTSGDLDAANFLEYSSDRSKLEECGIFIITVPTPIDTANRPDLTPIIKASETVGRAMRAGAIVIYESTVGVPARQIGWMSQHGERLALPLEGEGVAVCPATGARYRLHQNTLSFLED